MSNSTAPKRLNSFLQLTLGNYVKNRFNVTCDKNETLDLSPPYLLLANHITNWDPFIASIFIKHPIQYVCSDEFFRNRLLRFALTKLVGAIPKTKNISDMASVRQIIKVKRKKGIIGIFPEGKRSWDGTTLEVLYPTAKLVKNLKIPVVAALIKGGNLSYPRWANNLRRGKIFISYKVVLNNSEIKRMTVDEIHNKLQECLDYDEYTYQKQEMIEYKSKKSAEHLELFLFTCPKCKTIGSMKSSKKDFLCTECGYKTMYNDYGFFEGDHKSFESPKQWNTWQLQHLRELVDKQDNPTAPILQDKSAILLKGGRFLKLKPIGIGTISLNKTKLIMNTLKGNIIEFNINKMSGLTVQYNNKFDFYYEKLQYRIRFENRHISAYKWVQGIQMLSN